MKVPAQLKYTEDHEWVKLQGNQAVIGITDFAQIELGDIVFVELPEVGSDLVLGQPFGSVESVKTVSELYAPVSGKIVEINANLVDEPEQVNRAPYDGGWMVTVEITNPEEIENLWSAEKYEETYEHE